MKKKFALGIVIKDRWGLTLDCLNSLYYSDQSVRDYDLFLIDNGSTDENVAHLKQYVKSNLLPVKNLISIPETPVPKAWNLFLLLSKDYDFRVKYDNDLVLKGTIIPSEPVPKPKGRSLPGDTGLNPGAVPSAPPIKGLGQIQSNARFRAQAKKIKRHSAFLTHMREFAEENNVDISALVPVNPEQSFGSMWYEVIRAQWKGLPYIFGACMMITKKCFDTLGYFDERLPRRVDMEYSQRAIRNKFNIGYHPYFHVRHIGAGKSTERTDIIQAKYKECIRIQEEEGNVEKYAHSEWEIASKQIKDLTNDYRVLTLD